MEISHKSVKALEGKEGESDGGVEEVMDDEETMAIAACEEAMPACSEEMESNIQCICEKIERFTQRVSELLEAGKQLFKNLSVEFEDRLISIHREHMEKWHEEIKDLRMIDSANEEVRALLQNAQLHLLQNVHENQ